MIRPTNHRKKMNDFIKKLTGYKQQCATVIHLLDKHHPHNSQYINRLSNCCTAIDQYSDGSAVPIYPCKVHFCPLCNHIKARKEYAIARQVFNELMLLHSKPVLYFMTFTIQECTNENVKESVQLLKKAFERLVRKKIVKDNLLGASSYVHYGMSHSLLHPHLHVVFVFRASFVGVNYIKESAWQLLWQNALQVPYLPYVKFVAIKNNQHGFANRCAYGAISLKFEDIAAHPEIFNVMVHDIFDARNATHLGIIKILRKQVKDAYADSSKNNNTNKEVEHYFRFKNNAYIER